MILTAEEENFFFEKAKKREKERSVQEQGKNMLKKEKDGGEPYSQT